MKPEEKARQQIDDQLRAADWVVQSRDAANLGAARGVAVAALAAEPPPFATAPSRARGSPTLTIALSIFIAALGGAEAVLETFRAIQDVGRWWP